MTEDRKGREGDTPSERPMIRKETLKDLDPKSEDDDVKGGEKLASRQAVC